MKRRVRMALAAFLIVGGVVLVTSGGALLQVLHGELGQSWMPRAGFRTDTLGSPLVIVSAVAAAVPLLVLRNLRGVVFFVLGFGLAAVAAGTDMLSKPNPAVDAASVRAYFPVALCLAMASVIRVLRPLRRRLRLGWPGLARRLFALPVLGIGALTTASWALRFEQLAALPTDSLEAQHFIEWRRELPLDSDVRYLARAGSRLFVLPLYAHDGTPRARPLADGAGLPAIKKRPLYYYRSSLCSTPEGRAQCARHQQDSTRMQLVAEATLPARSSMRWDSYQGPTLRVGLYRILP